MKRGLASRARSPVSGPSVEHAPVPRATPAISGATFSAPSASERAEAAALIMPHADTQAMSAHLAEIAKTVASGAHALLILDGAGWHGSAELEVPDNITLLKLPPYSPELNPMENVWAYCVPTSSPYPSSTIMSRSSTGVAKHPELLCKRQNRNHVNHYQTMGQNGQRLGPLVSQMAVKL